jgi:hypothetical protein
MARIVKFDSPKVNAAIGNAITDSAERRSAPMLTALRPNLSTNHPPIGETKIPGKAEIAATNPAKAGESVRSKTNQGIVIINTEFPKPDEKFDI